MEEDISSMRCEMDSCINAQIIQSMKLFNACISRSSVAIVRWDRQI